MRFVVAFLIFCLSVPLLAKAEQSSSDEVLKELAGNALTATMCTMFSDPDRRLECYDNIFDPDKTTVEADTKPQTKPKPAKSLTGEWVVRERKDPMDDSAFVTLNNKSIDSVDEWGNRATLIVQCSGGTLVVGINWGGYIGFEGRLKVSWRLGNGGVREANWIIGVGNEVTIAPWPNKMLDELTKTDRFTARVHPESSRNITAVFDVAGLDQALLPVSEACDI